ncbi:uncharacterized protein THITE_2116768 [Thermothielavioides terrestris NRRL 8126]|uniref:AAA+ ATPase domain-containing protein n=1 Tax=Thermothielavioides terrestris (strain ATCC 38088 / NRRL 8126) TaxID=578455 RepID=G2R729_THETT|nr:uncharacterized protein THITE_2116768 [Thermothielavioides terrestris NRRL 8126]AEO67757.1 hypothetical protein THITE_2116768 [Thermothielavioides terrestris NRRL 8126]
MRCWKQALEQIDDHHANRVLPNFTPRSETEKALVDSLRRLELQCKERIDLLEALRLSRQESAQNGAPPSESTTEKPIAESRDVELPGQKGRGWIGNGTIPAVTYTELARPELPRRRSTNSRTPSSQKVVLGDSGSGVADGTMSSPSRKPFSLVPPQPSPETKTSSRASSPERHAMRTTLRASRLGEKLKKTTPRRSAPAATDGPGANQAAMLAWSSLQRRDSLDPGTLDGQELPRMSSSPPTPSEQSRRSLEALYTAWDSNSRRLTTPRTRSPVKESDKRVGADLAELRRTDGSRYAHPSPFSISAASSALSALTARDSIERLAPAGTHIAHQKTASPQTPLMRKPRDPLDASAGFSQAGKSRRGGRHVSSDSAIASRSSASNTPSASRSKAIPTRSRTSTSMTQARGSGKRETRPGVASSPADSDLSSSSLETPARSSRRRTGREGQSLVADSLSDSSTADERTKAAKLWKKRKAAILEKLPAGVDPHAAKQILNEIIVQGDEVHWGDIAGLEVAKNALRETVVYPFLRPDLFMGLREPARGMLLFGPPGTGKTMLARAVATESKSTFFSISASSLTSKYLGESEKLVRALFALAKVFAPSIIFVDEIDSLLSQRSGSGEHEATRRIKTEFLIQWSDLQRAAAGREIGEKDKERGDPNRVLVLAATNLPWAIDEAARRRFVRRQYIPLPEAETRAVQLRTLLKQQKHTLSDADIETLVGMTEGEPLSLLSRSIDENLTLFQGFRARILRHWPKMQPWDRFARSGRLCCTCLWMTYVLSNYRILLRAYPLLGRASAKLASSSMRSGQKSLENAADRVYLVGL